MTDYEVSTLKELINTKICLHNQIVDKRFESLDVALKLQAKEYERRLLDLNGEAARIRDIQLSSVPRETYQIKHEKLESEVKELRQWKDNQQGKSAVYSIILPLVISFLTGIMFFLLNHFL